MGTARKKKRTEPTSSPNIPPVQHTEPPRTRTLNQPSSGSPHGPLKESRPGYHSDPPPPAERPAQEKPLTAAKALLTRRSAPYWPRLLREQVLAETESGSLALSPSRSELLVSEPE